MEDIFAKKDLIYTIYEELSFSKAAQKLFIAQPSLSLTVKKLEQQLGVPLFDRTTKPISMTEAGMEYIHAVEQLRSTEESFKNYIRKVNRMEAGSLDIGSNQLLSSLILPKYVDRFIKQYPNIHLTVSDANSTTLEKELSVGNLDLVIDNHILDPELFEQQQLGQEQLFLAVPKHWAANEHAKAHQLRYEDILSGKHRTEDLSPVSLQIFKDVPFILMNRNNDTRKQTDAIFQQEKFEPKVLFEMDRLATLYSYIALGTAASVVSDTLIMGLNQDQSNMLFYPLPGPHARRAVYLSYRKNRHRSLAMTRFADLLQKNFHKD